MRRLFLAMTLMLGMGSFAHGYSLEGRGEGPCSQDRETFCADVEPGEGRLMKCMKDNADKLSKECKEHQAKAKEAMKDVKEACHADAEKLCGDVKPGRGRIMKCMKKHKDELSEGCKAEVENTKEMRKKTRKGN